MIASAVELFRRQGYHATALSQVIAESGAPRGSIYFHFPGGKEQLAVAAVARSVEEGDAVIGAASAEATDAAGFVRAMTAIVSERLESSDFRAGCAIATMVLELAPDVEAIRAEFDRVIAHWRAATAAQFEHYGYEPARATGLAALLLSTLEGGLILARAARSLEPLQTAGEALIAMLDPKPGVPRRRATAIP